MKNCPKCKNGLESQQITCPKCGYKIISPEEYEKALSSSFKGLSYDAFSDLDFLHQEGLISSMYVENVHVFLEPLYNIMEIYGKKHIAQDYPLEQGTQEQITSEKFLFLFIRWEIILFLKNVDYFRDILKIPYPPERENISFEIGKLMISLQDLIEIIPERLEDFDLMRLGKLRGIWNDILYLTGNVFGEINKLIDLRNNTLSLP